MVGNMVFNSLGHGKGKDVCMVLNWTPKIWNLTFYEEFKLCWTRQLTRKIVLQYIGQQKTTLQILKNGFKKSIFFVRFWDDVILLNSEDEMLFFFMVYIKQYVKNWVNCIIILHRSFFIWSFNLFFITHIYKGSVKHIIRPESLCPWKRPNPLPVEVCWLLSNTNLPWTVNRSNSLYGLHGINSQGFHTLSWLCFPGCLHLTVTFTNHTTESWNYSFIPTSPK